MTSAYSYEPRHVGHASRLARTLVLCLLAAVTGCTSLYERKPLNCPQPPVPICKPGTFDKVTMDTTFHGPGHTQLHVSQLPSPINSSASDQAITFVPSSNGLTALITTNRTSVESSTPGVQRMYSAKFMGTTKYGPLRLVSDVNTSLPFGGGFYSKADNLFYFAARASNLDADDFDLYAAKIVSIGDSIVLSDVHPIVALNSNGHFDSQPVLDPTGLHIYFVSDRPGGSGGTDIWSAHRTSTSNQDWSAPEPLAPPINSECDELSPYISPNDPNTFYFSSNGHATVGGYDLFKATLRRGAFGEPENLGKPINTPYDEIFPVALNDTAFFWSSNMPSGSGGMDLYTITRTTLGQPEAHGHIGEPERPTPEHLNVDTTPVEKPLGPMTVEVHVTRGNDHRPAIGSDVFVRRDSQEMYREKVPANGAIKFKVNRDGEYEFGAETEDEFIDLKRVDLRGYKDSLLIVNLNLPDTLVLRINFPFDDYEHPYEFVIDENGQPSSMTWHEALDLAARSALRSMDKLKELVLIGHTDSLGTDAYNERLGFRRATFAAEELEKRGVPHRLIRIESRGRTHPVNHQQGESDDLFRLRSRRIEFVRVFK